MKELTTEQLNKILEDHRKWLIDCDYGTRANLSGLNLTGVDLMGVNLSKANLGEAINY